MAMDLRIKALRRQGSCGLSRSTGISSPLCGEVVIERVDGGFENQVAVRAALEMPLNLALDRVG